MKKIKKKQIFMNLLMACHEHDTYSLAEICQKMGVSYKQIKEWAKRSKRWAYMLEKCHMSCASNVEIAALMKIISAKEVFRYLSENRCLDEYI